MSTTSIYRLGRDPGELGETRNAWLGAMYVWNDVAKRYCGLPNFPMGDGPDTRRVWNSHKNPRMAEHERIVLLSTMDNAAVLGKDRDALVAAFEKYGAEHPDSSLTKQAAIIRDADIQPGDLIAWQQTSVGEFWGCRWDDEADAAVWYDPTTDKHFDVIAEAVPVPADMPPGHA